MTHTATPSPARAPTRVGRLVALLVSSPLVLGVGSLPFLGLTAFSVDTRSMMPALWPDERFVADMRGFGIRTVGEPEGLLNGRIPRRADVVALSSPRDDGTVITRVIGLPGDTIEWREGVLIHNGVSLGDVRPCPHALGTTADAICRHEVLDGHGYDVVQATDPTMGHEERVRVPEGHVYVLGDRRDISLDSRAFGPVPIPRVVARAAFVYGSPTAAWRLVR